MNAPMFHKMARIGTEKERIWRIADELMQKTGALPSGRDVVDIYVAEGGNEGTGFTQYSHWKREVENALRRDSAFAENAGPGTISGRALAIAEDGRLVVPADMRAAMMLGADGGVTAMVEDGILRIISPLVAVRRLQRHAKSLVPEKTLVSDELIAERRAEAARE